MRAALKDKVGAGTPDHVGLGYDRWAPIEASTGKVPDERRKEWLRALARTRVSEDYEVAYERWVASLKSEDSCLAEAEMAARLLVGHGNPSPTEVGLTVHHTWGVPVIPGSALKGLLNHYVDAVYGPTVTGIHPMDPDYPAEERERAPYRGVTWAGSRIEHGPGEVHRALFGAPRAKSDELFAELGAGETAGLVVFHDALFVPGRSGDQPFATDVLTVHQKDYYDREGRSVPNDYQDPVPVGFLTVRPKTRFLVALSGPAAWTRLAMDLLRDALVEWGVGGKTTSGYGHVRREGWQPIWPTEETSAQGTAGAASQATPGAPTGPSALIEELRTWLSGDTPPQREKLALLGTEWLPRLLSGTPADRQEAVRWIRKKIKNERLFAERDKLLAVLANGSVGEPGEPA